MRSAFVNASGVGDAIGVPVEAVAVALLVRESRQSAQAIKARV
jgi:hypothetical protein